MNKIGSRMIGYIMVLTLVIITVGLEITTVSVSANEYLVSDDILCDTISGQDEDVERITEASVISDVLEFRDEENKDMGIGLKEDLFEETFVEDEVQHYLMSDVVESIELNVWSSSDSTKHKDGITASLGDTIYCSFTCKPKGSLFSSIKWYVNGSVRTSWSNKEEVSAKAAGTGKISIYVQVMDSMTGNIITSNTITILIKEDTGDEGVEVEKSTAYLRLPSSAELHTDSLSVLKGNSVAFGLSFTPANASYKSIKWYINEEEYTSFEDKKTGSVTTNSYGKWIFYAQVERNDGTIVKSNNVTLYAKARKGDVTGDGEVAMGDVLMVAKAVAGTLSLTNNEKVIADVTGDGEVAMGDVLKIAKYVAGTINEF